MKKTNSPVAGRGPQATPPASHPPLITEVFAIDPGTTESGWCLYDTRSRWLLEHGTSSNPDLLERLLQGVRADIVAIEMVSSYGLPVGREVFETIFWIGRFYQACCDPAAAAPPEVRLVYRRTVKMRLCRSMRVGDVHVRRALIDRLGPVGVKATPGPLYGVTGHVWSALAVAVTAAETVWI